MLLFVSFSLCFEKGWKVVFTLVFFVPLLFCDTNTNDFRILKDFRNGLQNAEVLKWPDNDDPCGPPSWPHVFCKGDRVTQLLVQNLGLKGHLPQDFNQLTELSNLGLQRNEFNGKLPTFKGLSKLRYANLGYNQFDTIPSDFAEGLDVLEALSLDDNPLNKSLGWSIPTWLQTCPQLMNVSLVNCGLIGTIPDFLGSLPTLDVLKLSHNRLTGGIPESFHESVLQILWLNNQIGDGLSGPIYVLTSMSCLYQLWLHGNKFTGTIPAGIGALVFLEELYLNENRLVGQIPDGLGKLEALQKLDVSNNSLMGAIPKFKIGTFFYANNRFCLNTPGVPCAPQVTSLLSFLGGVDYPLSLVQAWNGNDPCEGPWLGLTCNSDKKVSIINLPHYKLNGTLDPSLGELDALTTIILRDNNIQGTIPQNLPNLQFLRLLDLSWNNLQPPIPYFTTWLTLKIEGNPLLVNGSRLISPPNSSSPGFSSGNPSSSIVPPKRKKSNLVVIVAPVVTVGALVIVLVMVLYCSKKKKETLQALISFLLRHRQPTDQENTVELVVADNMHIASTETGSRTQRRFSSGAGPSHVNESDNLVISVQVLRNVTNNFSPVNELGRGGFGRVYKGELDDGTKIAVKRMEAGIITNKALEEFQSEIVVLSKVRHRHLVSLLGYCIEGNERILVYEYMPQGELSRHIFHLEKLKLEPLSWERRFNIALDVARAMEYLHSLAQHCFIHRDLKSSNILLDDNFRAKVSDFGLAKLSPDGMQSVPTRLVGTFGYMAPEYAATGKITTKIDVFSFGVVLMELLTGLKAFDEDRPEDSRCLAAWFCDIKSGKDKLMSAIDKALLVDKKNI